MTQKFERFTIFLKLVILKDFLNKFSVHLKK